jgi:hypothetical protein
MKSWFGTPYGASYEMDTPHVAVPVGQPCAWCEEPFVAGDAGMFIPTIREGEDGELVGTDLPYHYECHLRGFLGSANHMRGRCSCFGGTEDHDPPYLTKRQAAQESVDLWNASRPQPAPPIKMLKGKKAR